MSLFVLCVAASTLDGTLADRSYENSGKYQSAGSDIAKLIANWQPSAMLPQMFLDRGQCEPERSGSCAGRTAIESQSSEGAIQLMELCVCVRALLLVRDHRGSCSRDSLPAHEAKRGQIQEARGARGVDAQRPRCCAIAIALRLRPPGTFVALSFCYADAITHLPFDES